MTKSSALIATAAANHGWNPTASDSSITTYARGGSEVTVTFNADNRLASWTLLRPGAKAKSSGAMHTLLDLLATR